MDLIELVVLLSAQQKSKLINGHNITIKPESFVNPRDGVIVLMAKPSIAKRINSSIDKGKGVRINIADLEDVNTVYKNGGALSLKSITKAAKSLAKNKAVQNLAKKGINQYVIPNATNLVSNTVSKYTNDDIGNMSGALSKKLINFGVDKSIEKIDGSGLFKTLNKVGIKKKDVLKGANKLGKMAIPLVANQASQLAGSYGGPLAASLASSATNAGLNAALNKTTGEGLFKTLHKVGISKKDVMKGANKLGKMAIPLVANQASQLAGSYGGPLAASLASSATNAGLNAGLRATTGQGFDNSIAYKNAMKIYRRGGNLGTFSPILTPEHPAMNTTVYDTNNDIQGYNPLNRIDSIKVSKRKKGSSIYPAGRYGGSFMPSGR